MTRRLRIVRAHYEGFGPHRDTTLDLADGRIFNLVGPFGCGKSYIGEGLRWCIEGASARPVEYDPRIGGGDPVSCRVSFDMKADDEALSIWRTPSGASHSKQGIYATLGIRESSRTAKDDLTLVDVLLNPQRFFEVGAEARLRFIDRTFGDPLTLGELEAAGIGDAEVARACLRSLKAGLAKATEGRRDAERIAEAAASAKPEDREVMFSLLKEPKRLSAIDPDTYRTGIVAIRKKRDEARDRGNAILSALGTPDPRKVAKEALKAAEAAYKALVMGPEAKKASDIREQRAAIQNFIDDAAKMLKDLRATKKPCEKCGADLNLKEVAEVEKQVGDARAKDAELAFSLKDFDREESRAKGAVEQAKKAVAEAAPPSVPGGTKEEAQASLARAAEIEKQIQEVEGVLAQAVAYHASVKALAEGEEKRAAYLEEAARYRAMEGAIAALVEKRGHGPVPKIQRKMENVAERLGFACALTDAGEVTVKGAPVEQASRGQKMYAGLVVGCAVASLSGAGFLFVDDFASVDHAARLAVFKLLLAMVKGVEPMLEQVFLVSLTGPEKVAPPAEALKGVYRIFLFKGVGQVEEVK